MQNAVPAGRHAATDRGRRVLVSTLLVLAALAWAATIALARSPAAMSVMPGQAAPAAAALFAAMWLIMMAAMMLPAIVPVVLLFRTVQRQRGARGGPAVPAAVFVSGYLAVWLLAGLGADLAYTVAHALGARVPFGPWVAPYLGGAILVLAPSGIMKGVKHPQAARLFMEYLLSPEASQIWVDNFAETLRPEVTPPAGTVAAKDVKTVSPSVAEIFKGIPEVIKQWRDTFGV